MGLFPIWRFTAVYIFLACLPIHKVGKTFRRALRPHSMDSIRKLKWQLCRLDFSACRGNSPTEQTNHKQCFAELIVPITARDSSACTTRGWPWERGWTSKVCRSSWSAVTTREETKWLPRVNGLLAIPSRRNSSWWVALQKCATESGQGKSSVVGHRTLNTRAVSRNLFANRVFFNRREFSCS